MSKPIVLKKVKVHNLKGVSLTLPSKKLVVFTGVSGSGKSSLLFDTIYAEGQRRYLEALSHRTRKAFPELPKPDVESISGIAPCIALEQHLSTPHVRSTVGTMTGIYDFLRVLFARVGTPHCPVSGEPVAVQSREKMITKLKSLPEGHKLVILSPYAKAQKGSFREEFAELMRRGFVRARIDGKMTELAAVKELDAAILHDVDLVVDRLIHSPEHGSRLMESALQALEWGKGFFCVLDLDTKEELSFSEHFYSAKSGLSYRALQPFDFSFHHPKGMCEACHGLGDQCVVCKGARIKPFPAATRLGEKTLVEWVQMPVGTLRKWLATLRLSRVEQLIARDLLKEMMSRLTFLEQIGLSYLQLNRSAPSLSGGEAQRVRLAAHIGSGLVGAIYVLDEPSLGLHPQDQNKLLDMLFHLRDLGNSVFVVEHDLAMMRAADVLVDLGGGEVIAQGSVQEVMNEKRSITGGYLSGRLQLAAKKPRKTFGAKQLAVVGARLHNLKNIDVRIPLGGLVCITGVSGSGKSSLIEGILIPSVRKREIKGSEHVRKVIVVDQSPIGRSPRSNIATYCDFFGEIRNRFARQAASRALGLTEEDFRFNGKGGCRTCKGRGRVNIDRDFLQGVWIKCPECRGKRYTPNVLHVYYKGKTIADVLEMSVDEAAQLFAIETLGMLQRVGLGYLALGQNATTLSGGEAQRVKLARELARPGGVGMLYIFDEPTTGLHLHDLQMLLDVLQDLVEKGSSLLVIEHNMELVRTADWVIDLGPGAGEKGGRVVGEGPPQTIALLQTPTGRALKNHGIAKGRRPLAKEFEIHSVSTRGARNNNLKNISVEIPHGQMTIVTGVSGSGKTSFALDTIFAEGQRRFAETLPAYVRGLLEEMPKPDVDEIDGLMPVIALEQQRGGLSRRSTVGTITEVYDLLRVIYAHLGIAYCPETGEVVQKMSRERAVALILDIPTGERVQILSPLPRPRDFHELCEKLDRAGYLRIRLNGKTYALDEKIPYQRGRVNELFLVIDRLVMGSGVRDRLLESIEKAQEWGDLFVVDRAEEDLLFNLGFATRSGKAYPDLTSNTFSFNAKEGMCLECEGMGCAQCEGERLNPLARAVRLNGVRLPELCKRTLREVREFVDEIQGNPVVEEPLEQIKRRLNLLLDLDLHYLNLHRTAPSLSGGELQRVRLSAQLGTGLTSCLYILDEPTVGLHPKNSVQLLTALKRLRDEGNTLLVVEHDLLVVQHADHLVEFGPKAGKDGGRVVAQGTAMELEKNRVSLTGSYLSGRKRIDIPKQRRPFAPDIRIEHASLHNLKDLSIAFPKGAITCLTGVSGSGKSTLMHDLLRKATALPKGEPVEYLGARFYGLSDFEQVLVIDQTPLGQSVRADVSTYSGVLPLLRKLMVSLPSAQVKGLKSSHFSFNHADGMCRSCTGRGYRTVNLQFLPDVQIDCEECRGYRLGPLSMEIQYKGKHLGQILELTVEEALHFFSAISYLKQRLHSLYEVGLSYLRLGQTLTTLSGGEAQRLRLSKELAKRETGKTLYLLDEPTIGLHSEDLTYLLPIFHRLANQKNTLLIIEHHLDVIAHADHLIDLGPESGEAGGRVVTSGTPEQVATCPDSHTGKFLSNRLFNL
jgi:excinuclease ABC subunit A